MRGGVRAFGGFNLERTINDVCVSAASDPEPLLYCNQADSGIPWQKQFKATVVYPMHVEASQVSGCVQNLNGYLAGSAAQAYGGFTAGTGFDRPNGLGDLLAGDADDALCGELHGRVHAGRAGAAGAGGQRPGQRSACRSSRRKRSSRRASTRSTSR